MKANTKLSYIQRNSNLLRQQIFSQIKFPDIQVICSWEKSVKRAVYFASVTDTSPPGPLLYLDCEEVSQSELLLSWCWPLSQDVGKSLCGEVDNSITHAVVEYRDEQGWMRVEDVRYSPFLLHCKLHKTSVIILDRSWYRKG